MNADLRAAMAVVGRNIDRTPHFATLVASERYQHMGRAGARWSLAAVEYDVVARGLALRALAASYVDKADPTYADLARAQGATREADLLLDVLRGVLELRATL